MKILYGVQGTGNGHFSRASAITPVLKSVGEVDILVSGSQFDIHLPFKVKYRCPGIGFNFGSQGGIDIPGTLKSQRPFKFTRDVFQLPVEQYDLVISDFEPVTSWACKLKGKHCIGLSHQAAFLSSNTPRPERRSLLSEGVLKNYAPCSQWLGFHFESYDENIFTPVIRDCIREVELSEEDHVVVYLPAYGSRQLLSFFEQIKGIRWKIYVKGRYNVCHHDHISLMPVGHPEWANDVASASGIIMGAGFEGPSEMLYLGKKLMVIPMNGQYEQLCNAEALSRMGIPVIYQLNGAVQAIEDWLSNGRAIQRHYAFKTDEVVERVLEMASGSLEVSPA